jgi:hypothetical protein
MPRLARLPFIPFGWYYVGLRSLADRRIVASYADLVMALRLLRSTLRKKGAVLHAGYVAECEAHLALRVGEVPLSAITGGFQHEYARMSNRVYGARGSLFRLHYHALLIDHRQWLVPLVHHIHWIRRLESPDERPGGFWWSSDAVYRGVAKEDWVTTNVVLRMLSRGAYNREAQEEAYRKLFDRPPEPSHAGLFRRGSAQDPRILADSEFIEDVWRRTGRTARARRMRHRDDDIRGVVAQVIDRFNALSDARLPRHQASSWRRVVTYENVLSKSRKRPLPMVRALSMSYLIEHKIARPTQVAHFFGRGPRPVSARRRSFYAALFREYFDAKPELLFATYGADRTEHETGADRAAEVCDCP